MATKSALVNPNSIRRRRNHMYGNENGLPGLPKTTYVTVGGRRQPPRTQMRAPPTSMARAPPTQRIAPLSLPSGPDPGLSRRIDFVEQRISSTEQSNRTLLDELMRLQQEIKGNVRRNELGIQEEKDARNRLEMAIRQSQGKNFDAEDRVKRCEDGVKDNRGGLQQLSMHVGNVEKLVQSLQQENLAKKSEKSHKDQEQRNEIARLATENDHLERLVKNLQQETRGNSSRIDSLQKEVGSLSNSFRVQTKLMDDNARKMVPRTPGMDSRIIENDRANSEVKIIQLNTVIQDLSDQLRSEIKKRERLEQDFNNKFNSVVGNLQDSTSNSEKAQREYDEKMKEVKAGFSETEKRTLKMEMTRISNELNKKIYSENNKLRQDTVDKLDGIEKSLKEENKRREKKEQDLDKKLSNAIKDIEHAGELESTKLKTIFDERVKENKANLNELNKRITDSETFLKKHKLESEKVLNAEIQERLNEDRKLDEKIDDLEDDVQLAFRSLQNDPDKSKKDSKKNSKTPKTPQAYKGVDYDEITKMQDEKAAGIRRQVAEDIGNLETRVAALETDMKQKDEIIDNRLETSKNEDKESTAIMGDQLQQQIDAMVFKQTKIKKQVDDLEHQVQDTPKHLQTFKDETNDTINTLTEEVVKEKKERRQDVAEIKDDIDKIVGSREQGDIPSLAQLNVDVDQTQTGLKKCAESIHVVKTMFTDKLRDERKVREKETSILNSDVDRLDTKIKDLKERVKNMSNTRDNGMDDEDFL